jgi:hypothetical protein
MFFHLVNFIEMLGLSQQTPREGLLLVNGTKSWKLKLQKRSKALQPPAEPLGGKAGLPPPRDYSDQIITQLNPQKDSSEEQLQVTLYILSNLLEQRFW